MVVVVVVVGVVVVVNVTIGEAMDKKRCAIFSVKTSR